MRLDVAPATTLSAVASRVTSCEACSKCCGDGQHLGQLAGQPGVGPQPVRVLDALVLGVGPGHLNPAWRGLAAGLLLERARPARGRRLVLMKPSPIRAATSSAFGPKAET